MAQRSSKGQTQNVITLTPGMVDWWINDYQESLALRLASWLRVSPTQLKKVRFPYIRSMAYIMELADKLADKGFRVIYANFSHLEFRNGMSCQWPDLIIGKNGGHALVEVKGARTFRQALDDIFGKAGGTNFFGFKEGRGNYWGLALQLGACLFLAYFDKGKQCYMFIPVVTSTPCCGKRRASHTVKGIDKLIEESLDPMALGKTRNLEKDMARVKERAEKELQPLTIEELDKLFQH